VDDGAIGIELGGGVAGVVGKLLDQEFVGVAEFVLGDVGHRQDLRREMLDQVLERLVGQALTVGPGRIAEDAGKKIGVGTALKHDHRNAVVARFGGNRKIRLSQRGARQYLRPLAE
jgi:hypothetical protein